MRRVIWVESIVSPRGRDEREKKRQGRKDGWPRPQDEVPVGEPGGGCELGEQMMTGWERAWVSCEELEVP